MVDTSQSCPTNVSSKVELELCSFPGEMVLSGDGALAVKVATVVADSHSVVDLHGAGCGTNEIAASIHL